MFDHENQTDAGENLYAAWGQDGLSPSFIMKQAVDAWYREEKYFEWDDPENNVNFDNAGHFMQVVWNSTRSVGCAYKDCGDYDYVACRYWPAGNVVGEVEMNVLPGLAEPQLLPRVTSAA